MMQEEKKQLEILLMDYFRSCYTEFPNGKTVATESPDFLIKMKNSHQLGIELTRLNPANALAPNNAELNEIDFREGLINLTKETYERHSNMNLFVKFLFAEDVKVYPELEIITAVQLCTLIRKATLDGNRKSFFQKIIWKNELPQGIEQVLIIHHPKLKTAVWERSNNLGVSNDVVDDIRKAIHKKDEKLNLYQKQHLNYYWLLITTDRLRGVKSFNLSNKVMNHKFQSRFQRVFLFDLLKSKVYELV